MAEQNASTPTPPSSAEGEPQQPGRRKLNRSKRRRRWWIAAAVTAVAAAAVGWLAHDALTARDALARAAALVPQLRAQVRAHDDAGARQTAEQLQADADEAHAHTQGPLWSVAVKLPVVGTNATAITTVSEVLDNLSSDALPPLMDAVTALDSKQLLAAGGQINLTTLAAAGKDVQTAEQAITTATTRLAAVDPAALNDRIAVPLKQLNGQLAELSSTVTGARRALTLLPPMLGADGPRRYLLLVQNNAEVRATGGIPGSLVEITARNGAISIDQIRSGASVSQPGAPLPLTAQEVALYGPQLGEYMQDVNFTPDFPRTAQLARLMWQRATGHAVDGVLSMDPVALSHLLTATGPVGLPNGKQLTADNAVKVLLNDVYLTIQDSKAQDAFFAASAKAVFDAVRAGVAEPTALAEALATSADERRLFVWSAKPDEQKLVSETGLAGELIGSVGSSPVVGVYLNDGSGAKMSYYLDTATTVSRTSCLPDGAQELTVAVRLTSNAPANAATLPTYVTGGGVYAPPGNVFTNIAVYAPTGGQILDAHVGVGDQDIVQTATHKDLAVAQATTDLAPGKSITMTVRMRTAPKQAGLPVVHQTPGVRPAVSTVSAASCA